MPKIFRDLEKKLESIFENLFGKAFKTSVQPIEIARKLIHEMDDNKRIGVSSTYAPNVYNVYLSTQDREKLASFEKSVISELESYLKKHADKMEYRLFSRPKVEIAADESLALGEFGIATAFDEGEEGEGKSEQMRTMVFKPEAMPQAVEAVSPEEPSYPTLASKSIAKGSYLLKKDSVTIGRSDDNDIPLEDSKVSRRHAEIVRTKDDRYLYRDLGSTNGSLLNGKAVENAYLEDGDIITLGLSELSFKRR